MPEELSTREHIDALIAGAVTDLRRACRVDIAFGGALDKTDGGVPIQHMSGNLGGTLRSLRIKPKLGLGGLTLQSGRPLWVTDYFTTDKIVRSYDWAVVPERLRPAAAIPIVVAGYAQGLLYIANRGAETFGERVVGEAVAVARRIERDVLVHDEVRKRLAEATTRLIREREQRQSGDLREMLAEVDAVLATLHESEAADRLARVSSRLHSMLGTPTRASEPPKTKLSAREREVIEEVASGGTNHDIGLRLGLTTETVKAYLRSASRKLGASNRTQAVFLARRLGAIR